MAVPATLALLLLAVSFLSFEQPQSGTPRFQPQVS